MTARFASRGCRCWTRRRARDGDRHRAAGSRGWTPEARTRNRVNHREDNTRGLGKLTLVWTIRSSPAGGVVSIPGVSAHDKDGGRRTLEQRGDADDDLYEPDSDREYGRAVRTRSARRESGCHEPGRRRLINEPL